MCRRALSVLSVGVAAALGYVAPTPQDEALNAIQIAGTFFGFTLAGEAILFSSMVRPGDAWPSLKDITRITIFPDWVATGGLFALVTIFGTILRQPRIASAGCYAWAASGLVGLLSFILLARLADPETRGRLQARVLKQSITRSERMRPKRRFVHKDRNPVSDQSRYFSALDLALARADSASILELIDQIVHIERESVASTPVFRAQMSVLRKVTRATIYGTIDPQTTRTALSTITEEMVTRLPSPQYVGAERAPQVSVTPEVSQLGELSRYLAWSMNTAFAVAKQRSDIRASARSLCEVALSARERIFRAADPEPKNMVSLAEKGSCLYLPIDTLAFFRDFLEFEGPFATRFAYPAYQLLTGNRYEGDYVRGDPVLRDLCDFIYSSSGPSSETAASVREVVPTRQDMLTLLSFFGTAMTATFRERTLFENSDLSLDEFDGDPNRRRNALRMLVSLGDIETVTQATDLLSTLVLDGGPKAWQVVTSSDSRGPESGGLPRYRPRDVVGNAILVTSMRIPDDGVRGNFLSALRPSAVSLAASAAGRIVDLKSLDHRRQCFELFHWANEGN